MSFSIQMRAALLLTVLPIVQVACVSVPELESRLASMSIEPDIYVVQAGESVESIAFRYRLDPAELRAMNPQLANIGSDITGQRIVVHPAPDASIPSSVASYQGVQAGDTIMAQQPRETTIAAAVPQPTVTLPDPVDFDQIREIPASANTAQVAQIAGSVNGPIEEVVPDDLGYTTLPQATVEQLSATDNQNAAGGWVWPTWGAVAREFAPGEAGGQGIDIAGVPGQEIHAASGGTVAYAGRDVGGSGGQLIILRHSNGLMTTYSHAQQLFVAEDDVVRAGDVIANLGANARNESVLRFEVRQDGNPLNPMNFLGNQ